MGGYITKEQLAKASKREWTPEEKNNWERAMKPLTNMSKEERRKFFQEAREKFKDEFE